MVGGDILQNFERAYLMKKYIAIMKDRNMLREMVISLLGGKCAVCGSTENLHIHHIDGNRENNTAKNLILLCSSCHRRVHNGKIKLPVVVNLNEELYEKVKNKIGQIFVSSKRLSSGVLIKLIKQRFGISSDVDARRIIKQLYLDGYLVKRRKGRKVYYELIKK